MAFLVERMEKCLRAWEDYWFLIEVINTIMKVNQKPLVCPHENAVLNWSRFRKKLLRVGQEPLVIADFLPPNDKKFHGNILAGFAVPVVQWCTNSRRVYHITEELQSILDATSLDGVTWYDVQLPFVAYAIKLDRPMVDREGDRFDFIMVTTFTVENGGQRFPAIELTFLTQSCDQYEPMNEGNRQNIRERMRNRDYGSARKLFDRFWKRIDCILGSHIELWSRDFNEEVTSTAQRIYNSCDFRLRDQMDREIAVNNWDSLIRIVVGMCLYLRSLPSVSRHRSDWRPVPRSGLPDPRAISNEAQVCTVSSCYELTTQERVMLGLQGTRKEKAEYELSCHFRQGHWRRAPGYGHLPDAPKTVHVRPCLVRKDRLREGELPGGSEAIV